MVDNFGGCTDDNMVRNDEVVGSIPTSSTKFLRLSILGQSILFTCVQSPQDERFQKAAPDLLSQVFHSGTS